MKPRIKPISPAELAQREKVFAVYRDLGANRSYKRLIVAVRDTFGPISPARLNKWSQAHSWQDRLRVYDNDLAKGQAAIALNPDYDPNYDVEEALLHSAQIALTRALSAIVVPQNAHQMKALIDLAINALKLIEARRSGRQDAGKLASGKKRVSEMLDEIEDRVRAAYELAGQSSGGMIDVTPQVEVAEAQNSMERTALPAPTPETTAELSSDGRQGVDQVQPRLRAGRLQRVGSAISGAKPKQHPGGHRRGEAHGRTSVRPKHLAVAGQVDQPETSLTFAQRLALRSKLV